MSGDGAADLNKKTDFSDKSLFVWREASDKLMDDDNSGIRRIIDPYFLWGSPRATECPFCKILLVARRETINSGDMDWCKCALCGWEASLTTGYMAGVSASWYRSVVAREFSLSSTEVAIGELGAHIKKRFSDLHILDWPRFEALVHDVFTAHGMQVVQTKLSWDLGADLLVIGKDGEIVAIVECKKYSADRKVGIGLIRSLIGAAVFWSVRRAYLVTSSHFTAIARDSTEFLRGQGFDLHLVDADDLLRLLQVYDHELPLQEFDPARRNEIIEDNRRRIESHGLSFLAI